MRRLFATVLVALFLVSSLHADGKEKDKKKFATLKNPDQWVELSRVADIVAEQPCGNWAWAAGLQTLLLRQKVELDQRYWIFKVNGGLRCLSSAGSLEDLKKFIDGVYVQPDGSNIRLTTHYYESLPETTDQLLLPLAKGRPYLLWWKGRPYLVKGATWDELIYQTGQKLVFIKTLKMVNPLETGTKREVIFDRQKDNPSDLGPMMDVEVITGNTDPF